MKRYLLFAGVSYYPRGGAEDLIGDFNKFQEATKRMREFAREDELAAWANILDTVVGHVVHYYKDRRTGEMVRGVTDEV